MLSTEDFERALELLALSIPKVWFRYKILPLAKSVVLLERESDRERCLSVMHDYIQSL